MWYGYPLLSSEVFFGAFFASPETSFRLKKSGNLDAIQIIRVKGGTLEDSFLDEGEEASPISIPISGTVWNEKRTIFAFGKCTYLRTKQLF
jgi:hypothetical protein